MGALRAVGWALLSSVVCGLVLSALALILIWTNVLPVEGVNVPKTARTATPTPARVLATSTCPLRPESSRERELCERIDQLVRDRGR